MSVNTTKFLSEIFMLKRNRRSGWFLAGKKEGETLADHICLAAQIAYLLGEMEGLDGKECAFLALFHDNGEARTGDHHKVSARYLRTKKGERTAYLNQLANLPPKISRKLQPLFDIKENRTTPEGIVAQDADWLEAAIQAKIYLEQGYAGCQNWIDNVTKALETKSAKQILTAIKKEKDFTNSWWRGVKKMTYRKLRNQKIKKSRNQK